MFSSKTNTLLIRNKCLFCENKIIFRSFHLIPNLFGKQVFNYSIVEPFRQSIKKRVIKENILKPIYAKPDSVNNNDKYKNYQLIKSDQQIRHIRDSCRIAKKILTNVGKFLKVGVSGDDIDDYVFESCMDEDCYPSPLNYQGFPKCVTTSVNNVAVHGIPDQRKLINGDIITVDVSIYFRGFHGDCAHTFIIGETDISAKHLVQVSELCLYKAINICKDGQHLSLIGKTIEKTAKQNGFNVIPAFCGHGVGADLHEPPQILHYDHESNAVMSENMVITIEPVITEGEGDVLIGDDQWTVFTEDNCRTAQFEHTICVKKDNAVILTDYNS